MANKSEESRPEASKGSGSLASDGDGWGRVRRICQNGGLSEARGVSPTLPSPCISISELPLDSAFQIPLNCPLLSGSTDPTRVRDTIILHRAAGNSLPNGLLGAPGRLHQLSG